MSPEPPSKADGRTEPGSNAEKSASPGNQLLEHGPAGQGTFPVARVTVGSFRRAQRELTKLYEWLAETDDRFVAPDAAAYQSIRAKLARRRLRYERRRDFLQAYMDQVLPDAELTELDLVVPGCLVVVVRGDEEGAQTYEIAEIPDTGEQRLSPGSDLAQVLMWRSAGEPLDFTGPTGSEVSVTISRIVG